MPTADPGIEAVHVQPNQNDSLVLALRTAARNLTRRHSIHDLEETLRQIVVSAVDTIPGVDAGSISLTGHGRVGTRQPTNEVIGRLDAVQGELYEGPCITAIEEPPESGVVVACDFEGELDNRRWPRFAPRALDAGYRALLSTQITPDGVGLRAALNLYSVEANTFDEYTRTMASLFGAQAAMLLYGSDEATHLRRALDNRDLIGRAKGILMERFKVDDEAAFQMLVKSSQETNMKLIAVAEWLTTSVTPD